MQHLQEARGRAGRMYNQLGQLPYVHHEIVPVQNEVLRRENEIGAVTKRLTKIQGKA